MDFQGRGKGNFIHPWWIFLREEGVLLNYLGGKGMLLYLRGGGVPFESIGIAQFFILIVGVRITGEEREYFSYLKVKGVFRFFLKWECA